MYIILLMKFKKPILENLTTTWLMRGIPQAIQKQVDGSFTSDWQGKKIDRASAKETGMTSGPQIMRRKNNVEESITDTEWLDIFIKNNKIVDVGKNVKIPKESIVHDLTNFTICPSFIDVFTEYGQPTDIKNEQTIGSWNPALNIEYNAVNYFSINKNEAKGFINSG